MHFVGSKGLCSVCFFFLFLFFLTFQPTFLFCFVFPIVVPIQCRVFPSRRSLRFVNVWLLRFLLSVSDVQPDVLSASSSFCSIHTGPLPPTPFRSLHLSPTATSTLTCSQKENHRVCVRVCARVCVCERARERERERWLICSKKESTDHIRLS